jgi:hypothetical protein
MKNRVNMFDRSGPILILTGIRLVAAKALRRGVLLPHPMDRLCTSMLTTSSISSGKERFHAICLWRTPETASDGSRRPASRFEAAADTSSG